MRNFQFYLRVNKHAKILLFYASDKVADRDLFKL